MEDITTIESRESNDQIQQKVHDSFKDYPETTRKGVELVLDTQRKIGNA